MISRKFDYAEAGKRVGLEGDDRAKDDDGHFLKAEAGTFAPLEVAHIIPHSLMNVSSGKTEMVCTHSYTIAFHTGPSPPRTMLVISSFLLN